MTAKKKANVKVRIKKATVRGHVPLTEGKHMVVADHVEFEVHGDPAPLLAQPLVDPVELELHDYSGEDMESGLPLWVWCIIGLCGLFMLAWATH